MVNLWQEHKMCVSSFFLRSILFYEAQMDGGLKWAKYGFLGVGLLLLKEMN